MIPDMYI